MRKIYLSIFFSVGTLVMTLSFLSCSENEDDISAPSIISTYPAENDTIQLVLNYITLRFVAKDDVKIDKMTMNISCQEATYPINIQFAEDTIENQYFSCVESFPLYGLTTTIPVKWTLYLQNEYHSWKKQEVNFWVKP